MEEVHSRSRSEERTESRETPPNHLDPKCRFEPDAHVGSIREVADDSLAAVEGKNVATLLKPSPAILAQATSGEKAKSAVGSLEASAEGYAPSPIEPRSSNFTGAPSGDKVDFAGGSLKSVEGRNVAALLNPRPVVLVGAALGDEVDFATVAWVTPVSHTPPKVVFALRGSSFTYSLIEKSGWCTLNVPDEGLLGTVVYCGTHSGAHVDKKTNIPYRLLTRSELSACGASTPYPPQAHDESSACGEVVSNRSALEKLPVIEGSLSVLVAKVTDNRETGDHRLVTVDVVGALTRCATDGRGLILSTETLLCLQHDCFVTSGRPIA